ncbi:Ger(x)C family spore germination C-terminal domain-containing protein [Paenibacillus oenotherae]|uniref:Ger(X)C family spore germination C-terminal domain-containing protein n=1 Tax=Paenibacillus oenotherae TaxID=1435645 RepID=A0ABS7D6P4_9BACL|nr:Ger(x)C family spore germination C-terminal domain-containing protein [Paenibacillus oenotherae]
MSRQHVSILLLTLLILLTGCGDQRILERTGFIQVTSYDLLKDGRIQFSISIPKADPEIKVSREFLTTVAQSGKEARIKLARQTNLLLVSGQLRTTLFGLSIARDGFWEQLDTLLRDPTTSEQIKIVVVNGVAHDMLKKNYKEYPRTGKYIDRLIEKEAKGHTIPVTTLYSFTRDYYDDGIEPVAPIVKDAGKSIEVDGIALFHDGTYAGKIKADDTLIFAFLRENFKHGEISLDLAKHTKESKTVMLSSLNSLRKMDISHKGEHANVNIDISLKVSVVEYIGELSLGNKAHRHKLEQQISEILTHRATRLIQYLQEKKVDSIGVGIYVRNSMTYRAWKKLDWYEEFPHVNIQCKVKAKIKDYGFRR